MRFNKADIDEYVKQEWDKDPKNWSNNKRKIHGYPLRRKPLQKPIYHKDYQENKYIIFSFVEKIIDERLKEEITINEDFKKIYNTYHGDKNKWDIFMTRIR